MKKIIGYCCVDSGQIMIGDPCYLDQFKDHEFRKKEIEKMSKSKRFNFSYSGACAATLQNEQAGQLMGKSGFNAAVVAASGYGDGQYPVYATYKDKGDGFGERIQSLTIKFS